MGISTNPSIEPDLFSAQPSPEISSSLAGEQKPSLLRTDKPAAASSPSYSLPTNLPSALRHLDDDQLARLLAAVLAEQLRRGKKLPVSDKPSRKKSIKKVAPPLPQGRLNAIRAAFKAGISPSRIAKQFGVSQADVRKALANDTSPATWPSGPIISS